jgi:hypothetical protein
MLFTIEIMKERLTSSGLSPLTLAFTSCRKDAMHRFAIGNPHCVHHELFADFRVWMVDRESVRLKLYSRGCGSFGLVSCSCCRWHRDIRSGVHVGIPLGTRAGRARGSATRRRSFAAAMPCNFNGG